MPRLSVIMPAYNAEKSIKAAVQSTLADLPEDSELVVLDDASSDNTLHVLHELARRDARLIVHRGDKNQGASSALRALLAGTDSEFVARMDADDVVLRGRFSAQIASMTSTTVHFSFMTVVHYWPSSTWRPPRALPTMPIPITAAAMPYHLLMVNPVAHSTLMARRDSLASLGGYRSVPAEDYDLWLRAALAGVGTIRLARPGLAYRHHASQVTASTKWTHEAATNSDTAAVHADLTQLLLGETHRVFEDLRSGVTRPGTVEALSEFRRAVIQAASALNPLERAALLPPLMRIRRKIAEYAAQ